jgi:microcystin-dependent protein
MHRIDHATATVDNLFTEGDPVGGIAATVMTDDWANAVQEEICEVVETAGLTLNKADNTQLRVAIQSLVGAALVGKVMMWFTGTAPTGWLALEGAAVSRTTYASLFSVIGTMYGVGDGSTTFNLPDMRGRFPRGWNHGAGVDPDAASRTNRGDGTVGDYVGTKQADEYRSHDHQNKALGASINSVSASTYAAYRDNTSYNNALNTNASGGN